MLRLSSFMLEPPSRREAGGSRQTCRNPLAEGAWGAVRSALALGARAAAPRRPLANRNRRGAVHRNGGDAVLRRAFDEAVRVGQIDQRVALAVDHAHDAQLLEENRQPLVEDLFLLRQRLGERN